MPADETAAQERPVHRDAPTAEIPVLAGRPLLSAGAPPRGPRTGRWTVVGSIPYRRRLYFDRAAVADPAPVADRTDRSDPDPNVPERADSERAERAERAGSGHAGAERPGEMRQLPYGDPLPRPEQYGEPDRVPFVPAQRSPLAESAVPRADHEELAPEGPDAVQDKGSEYIEPIGWGDESEPAEPPVHERRTPVRASEPPPATGTGVPVEVVDLDGSGAGSVAETARPDRWYERSARLLGVRRALLDPGRRGLRALAVLAVVAVVAAGVVAWRLRPVADPVEPPRTPVAQPASPSSPSAGAELVVSVVGKVRHPGVVRVPAGSRVADAVRAAGGALPGADLGMLNQARRVVDGEQIAVGVTPPPDPGAAAAPGGSANPAAKVDLNTATADQLDTLPGVGPALAGRIIAYRTEHGGFRSVEELQQVSGIGDARYADLKDLVTV